ncbi:hypothetical protein [Frigoribacterium sp. VKM Ac-2836]|uniref:hypothetical protein n=1 Tax=Frigoribacterium sp. VKM Ac-2836 TaxID=2739014 RepID=UPI0015668459|nr:hypothetical protein [Frigoribacterium sp. VKM Ac-2836]NRD25185.1 hypothetical protein [Frigoribacterium sp. VKM Ac-2836]
MASNDPDPVDPADAPASLPPEMPRSLTILRDEDAPPVRAAPWREVRVAFLVPTTSTGAAARVRHLLDEPELHFTPGLRRGTLALMPRRSALLRIVLDWEWSVEAASFAVHSFDPEPFTAAERDALESWLRATARRLQLFEGAIGRAVTRVDHDVVRGIDTSSPESSLADAASVARASHPPTPAADPNSPGTGDTLAAGLATAGPAATTTSSATLGTRLASPAVGAAHPVVDVTLPDPSDPGWEVFVDATSHQTLGYRRTLDEGGSAYAFSYLVADDVDDVTPEDLVDWHDQHIQRQLLVEDARQAYVHLLAGLEPPVSVQYTV